ncbi:KilA-N domain-containing protein [Algoriphagus antarcticus]|uniref:KilA domain-containing protein n=1 Tax=Algoriphagus antarcticus TaxID=238540 RepID=A0A3E0EBD2_9BACT|nr:KilA-N domain-containing protein [Algoriphagus antarcticus]REG94316.1 KilA domain-containing protein [Algoriphagus antarcticus]
MDGDFFISDWLRNRNTVEFLGIWETVNNPNFNSPEFGVIEQDAGVNRFIMSVGQWITRTQAKGMIVKAGRYGGTYAHKDIAFHFAMWLSPEFQIYLVNEFQRLKEDENNRLKLNWDFQRSLSKVNYHIHTDAIKENLIPEKISSKQSSIIYASEADVLNIALFGIAAKQWLEDNPSLKGNVRDYATIEQLVVLSNMESTNALLIHQETNQSERLIQLNQFAITQMKSLVQHKKALNQLKK